MWDSNSMQDTALYMLMNLAISQTTQPYLNKNNVGNAVSLVAKYSSSLTSHSSTGDEEKQKDLQCLKAVRTTLVLHLVYIKICVPSSSFISCLLFPSIYTAYDPCISFWLLRSFWSRSGRTIYFE